MSTTMTVQDTIEREVTYPQTIERVWSALTEAEQLKRWFGSQSAEIDLRPGGDIRLIWEDMKAKAIVETVNPKSHVSWRWKPGNMPIDWDRPLAEQEPLTTVAFFLEPVSGGTHVRLVESGFSQFSEEQRISALEQNNGGWDHCFNGLAGLLGTADVR